MLTTATQTRVRWCRRATTVTTSHQHPTRPSRLWPSSECASRRPERNGLCSFRRGAASAGAGPSVGTISSSSSITGDGRLPTDHYKHRGREAAGGFLLALFSHCRSRERRRHVSSRPRTPSPLSSVIVHPIHAIVNDSPTHRHHRSRPCGEVTGMQLCRQCPPRTRRVAEQRGLSLTGRNTNPLPTAPQLYQHRQMK